MVVGWLAGRWRGGTAKRRGRPGALKFPRVPNGPYGGRRSRLLSVARARRGEASCFLLIISQPSPSARSRPVSILDAFRPSLSPLSLALSLPSGSSVPHLPRRPPMSVRRASLSFTHPPTTPPLCVDRATFLSSASRRSCTHSTTGRTPLQTEGEPVPSPRSRTTQSRPRNRRGASPTSAASSLSSVTEGAARHVSLPRESSCSHRREQPRASTSRRLHTH